MLDLLHPKKPIDISRFSILFGNNIYSKVKKDLDTINEKIDRLSLLREYLSSILIKYNTDEQEFKKKIA